MQRLAGDPLRNVVLLKQLVAYPDHTRAFMRISGAGTATLILLDAASSAYDRHAYPAATYAAFIDSNDKVLTREILQQVPRSASIVFKLLNAADHDVVASEFALRRTACFLSFTDGTPAQQDDGVGVAVMPTTQMFELFRQQDHAQPWLEALLDGGRAFVCALEADGAPAAVCFAFENYGSVWEIGGVVTAPAHRRRGFAARVVRAAVSELRRRELVPRYQTSEDNVASIRLARSIGMRHFLSVTHFLHEP